MKDDRSARNNLSPKPPHKSGELSIHASAESLSGHKMEVTLNKTGFSGDNEQANSVVSGKCLTTDLNFV